MNWLLPAPLPLVAAIVAVSVLALLRGDGHAPPSCPGALLRRLGEAVITALGVIATLWVGWLVLWLITHRS